jgi:hypothetical protein
MIQVRAFQTQRALLTLKPDEITLVQLSTTLSAGRGGPTQNENDQILALFGAGHAGILHRHEGVFNLSVTLR